MTRFHIILPTSLLAIMACVQDQTSTSPRSASGNALLRTIVIGNRTYYPVGTIIPRGTPLEVPIEPPDPRRHHPVFNSMADLNLIGRPGFETPTRPGFSGLGRPSNSGPMLDPDPAPGTLDIIVQIRQDGPPKWTGVFEISDAGLDISLAPRTQTQGGAWLYAPVMLPPDSACLETTTAHRRLPGHQIEHLQGWWNWCNGPNENPGFIPPMIDLTDATVANRYIRDYLGKPTLTLALLKLGTSCTYSWIYNYEIGNYEINVIKCPNPASHSPGNDAGRWGWSGWESWYLLGPGQCPVLPNLRAIDIEVQDPQTGSFLPLTNSQSYWSMGLGGASTNWCFTNFGGPGPYTFTFPGSSFGLPVNSWFAQTSPPTSNPQFQVSINGTTSVGPNNYTCGAWTAVVQGGQSPFQFAWSGFLTSTDQSVGGTVPMSGGELTVAATDAYGWQVQASLFVTYDPSNLNYCE
jgi:hypothetical protein